MTNVRINLWVGRGVNKHLCRHERRGCRVRRGSDYERRILRVGRCYACLKSEGEEALNKDELLKAIETRNTYAIFANAFRQHSWDVIGQGWPGTKVKLEWQLNTSLLAAETLDELKGIYVENILYAQKAVTLWAIDREVAQQLFDRLEEFVDPDSPYRALYPLPLPDQELRGLRLGIPTYVHDLGNRKTLVLGSRRTTSKEETLPPESISDALRDQGFVELVGRRNFVSPVFDSITVTPASGLVEMRIDLAKGFSEREILSLREGLRAKFNLHAREVLGVDVLLDQLPLNLWPALRPLYLGDNWSVQRLGHVNEGGYINANRGRHRTQDVRDDNYHRAGEGAVANLQLWSVTAVFSSPGGYATPTLSLEGDSRLVSMLQPQLDLARVWDCACAEDYYQVLDTLLECLPPHTETQSGSDA